MNLSNVNLIILLFYYINNQLLFIWEDVCVIENVEIKKK